MRERYHLEYPGLEGMIILIWILKYWDGVALTGLIWFSVGTVGGHLYMW